MSFSSTRKNPPVYGHTVEADTSPARKRFRSSDSSEADEAMTELMQVQTQPVSTSNAPTPIPTVWITGGDAIIVTGPTKFLVSRAVAAHHSPLLSLLLSEAPSGSLDGVPTFSAKDTVDNVGFVLGWIFHLFPAKELDMRRCAQLLYLGTKYEIKGMQDEAKAALTAAYPRRLLDYDNHIIIDPESTTRHPLSRTASENVVAVFLARCYKIPHILPSAILLCCRLSLTDLLACAKDARRVYEAFVPEWDATYIWMVEAYGPLRDLFEKRPSLVEDTAWSTPPRARYSKPNFAQVLKESSNEYPLTPSKLPESLDMQWDQAYQRGRLDFWDSLPARFGLPLWGELEKGAEAT
ncbi:hypothetical protein K488DRAFT_88409 [Vararia minispora EC-137]|uniref:Uncharacterized protein n=1 Tax=Vararia minispora EC-137 TaxID=1314806 RepID=A0ACB8QDQ8_9AGAM|nr:hypothetical protein K488DRAFT_88409 [Vararia minispora EC-137]